MAEKTHVSVVCVVRIRIRREREKMLCWDCLRWMRRKESAETKERIIGGWNLSLKNVAKLLRMEWKIWHWIEASLYWKIDLQKTKRTQKLKRLQSCRWVRCTIVSLSRPSGRPWARSWPPSGIRGRAVDRLKRRARTWGWNDPTWGPDGGFDNGLTRANPETHTLLFQGIVSGLRGS